MNKHMYILADGGRIAASGPSEFVRLLREGSWFDSECTDEEYMVNFSGRYREDRKSTRLNSSHNNQSRMPSSA